MNFPSCLDTTKNVVYHFPCSDGLLSAWILKKFLKTQSAVISWIPAKAGKIPTMENTLYLDCYPSLDALVNVGEGVDVGKISEQLIANNIRIIDHHDSNPFKNLSTPIRKRKACDDEDDEDPRVIFSTSKATCQIIFELLAPKLWQLRALGYIVDIVGKRDTNPASMTSDEKAINSAMIYDGIFHSLTSLDQFMTHFSSLSNENSQALLFEYLKWGAICRAIEQKDMDREIARARFARISGTDFLAWVCESNGNRTEVALDLLKQTWNDKKPDFVITWRHDQVSGEFWLSIKAPTPSPLVASDDVSENKTNCIDIAKMIDPKGGGHPLAAGATMIRPLKEIFEFFNSSQ